MLAALGLEPAFDKLGRRWQEAFWAAKFEDPIVSYGDDVPADARRAFERAIAQTTTEIETASGERVRLPSRDFATVLFGIRMCVLGTRSTGMPPDMREFLAVARPVLDAAYEKYTWKGWAQMAQHAEAELIRHSRADGRMLYLKLGLDDSDIRRPKMLFDVRAGTAERSKVAFDKAPRPAHRLGYQGAPEGIHWVSWQPKELGIGPEESPLPVYVQAHALHHLRERADAPGCAPWAEWCLANSLAKPDLTLRHESGAWLVPCHLHEYKLGYAVVAPARGAFVVRTFLSLTMRGTPEGDRLHKRFRLTRSEAEWLHLHRMSSFTQTDLRDDAELREMLDASGCGHLIEMRLDDDCSPLTEGYAAAVRKFIGLAPVAVAAAFDRPDDSTHGPDQSELRDAA
jgi:hypothetical protein